jgi:tetratricopeptide (TPR) repeat protein
MTPEDPNYDRIEAYLEKTMSEKDLQAFEQEIKQDSGLAKELASHRHTRKVLAVDRRSSLMRELQDAENSATPEEAPVRTLLNWKPFMAVAAVLLLLLAWALFLRPEAGTDPTLLASEAFEAYPATGTLMGDGSSPEKDAYAEGIAAYDERDYILAIEKLELVPQDDPRYGASRLYLGNVYLALVEPDKAIEVLEAAQKAGDANLREAIQWYLGLAYLSDGNEKMGRSLLENLATTSTDIYGEKAKELLGEME